MKFDVKLTMHVFAIITPLSFYFILGFETLGIIAVILGLLPYFVWILSLKFIKREQITLSDKI